MFHHSVSHDLQPIILYIAIITYIPKIHQTANAIGMWQLNGLEALLLRFIFLTVKERQNPLDYFSMEIIKTSFFFFDVETQSVTKTLSGNN